MPPADDLLSVLADLPHEHLALLRGVLCGFDTPGVAALAGVPPEAVIPLVGVAVAKLSAALGGNAHPGRPGIAGDPGR